MTVFLISADCPNLNVETVLGNIKKVLESGEDILSSHRGWNPQMAAELVLGAMRVVPFRSLGVLNENINEKS